MLKLLIKLIAPLAKPGQFTTLVRSILKVGGFYLTQVGFSEAVVNQAIDGLVPLIAGAVTMLIGLAASSLSNKKKKAE